MNVIVTLLFQAICFSGALAQENLTSIRESVDLTNRALYFTDSTKKIQLNDFLKLRDDQFHTISFPAFEASAVAVWCKTEVINTSSSGDYVVYFDQPILGSVDFWVIDGNAVEHHSRYSYDSKEDRSLNRYPHFLIPKFTGKKEFIFRLENSFFPINTLVLIAKDSSYERSEKIEGGGLLLCFGVSIVIIIYGCIFFFTIREKVYLWFLIYTFSMFVISLLSFGFARVLININSQLHNSIGILMSSVALSSLILFVQDILDMKTTASKLLFFNKIAIALSWGIFLSQSILWLKIFSSVCVVYVSVITIYVFIKKKDRSTLFFLLSSSFAIAGILIWGAVNSGFAPNNFFTHNALILGVTFESVFFSFNLSYRIRKIDEEKNRALVYEKTELSNSNKKLLETQNELENFIYRSHHDYRGPLARISGIVNLMKIDKLNFPVYYDSIKQESSILNENFDKTLTSWDIEHKHEISIEEIRIREEIEKIIATFYKLSFEPAFVTLNLPDNLIIALDKRCFTLSIRYVIENALIFSNADDRVLRIDYENHEGRHDFYFRNKGVGVDPKIADRIFDRHVRGSNKSQGSGLGLFIAKQALKKINASIEFIQEDEYTCFRISCVDLQQSDTERLSQNAEADRPNNLEFELEHKSLKREGRNVLPKIAPYSFYKNLGEGARYSIVKQIKQIFVA